MSDWWYICFEVAFTLKPPAVVSVLLFRAYNSNVTWFLAPKSDFWGERKQPSVSPSAQLPSARLQSPPHESRAASLRLRNLLKYPVTCDAPFLFKSCSVSMLEIKETIMCAGSACDVPPSRIFKNIYIYTEVVYSAPWVCSFKVEALQRGTTTEAPRRVNLCCTLVPPYMHYLCTSLSTSSKKSFTYLIFLTLHWFLLLSNQRSCFLLSSHWLAVRFNRQKSRQHEKQLQGPKNVERLSRLTGSTLCRVMCVFVCVLAAFKYPPQVLISYFSVFL